MIRNSFNYTRHTGGIQRLGLGVSLSALVLAACSSDDSESSIDYLQPVPVDVSPPDAPEAPPAPEPGDDAPNGVAFPSNVFDWRVIGISEIPDNPDTADANESALRVVVGNDIAVEAARSGETNPWPDGTMLGRIGWAGEDHSNWANTLAPGAFQNVAFMVRDSTQYPEADGYWAYGLWNATLTPPAAADFDRACVGCHTSNVADNDMVFTRPGPLPASDAMGDVAATPTGLEVPEEVLNWRVIGAAKRNDVMEPNPPTLRVIVGNDIAVEAARAGNTDPWPEGSMIAHYVWAAGENPDWEAMLGPVGFGAITLMVRDGEEYADDGGWADGVWNTEELTPPAAAAAGADEYDRACVSCHTTEVSDLDFVFTRPGALPELP